MRPILLLLACGIGLAACGGGGDDGSSAEEYRREGNAICREAGERIRALDPPNSPEEIAPFLERAVDLGERMQDRFEELDPPSDLRELHDQAAEAGRESLPKMRRIVDDVRESDQPIVALREGFQDLAPEIREGERLNRRLGLEACNQTGLGSGQQAPS